MKEKNDYQINRENNIKRTVSIALVVFVCIVVILTFSMYIAEDGFRNWVNINILRKEISSEDISVIDLDTAKNNQIFCYSKYICILNDKNLSLYNSLGEKTDEISLNINTALFASNNTYLSIAENGGQEICLIEDKTFLWSGNIEGEILQIDVNKNGYVVIVSTDTTYKSIITLYSPSGKQLFRNYLSSTRVIDASISNDNKYVAFAEMDTSGTLIQSNIKVISVENAQNKTEEAIIYNHTLDVSKMIVNIKYQDKGQLACMYNDSLNMLTQETENEIVPIDKDITFSTIDLNNHLVYIKEETSGVFSSTSILNIINTSTNQKFTYEFDEVAKEIYSYGDVIAINIGTEIYFVKTNGSLIKKYISNQEITNVILSNDIATLIYKNKIEIINL